MIANSRSDSPSFANRIQMMPTVQSLVDDHDVILFSDGYASPAVLPDLSDVALLAAKAFRTETLQYSSNAGLDSLREWICTYLREQGVHVTPDAILVVNGAKHGIELVCKLFLDPGDAVAVTRPNYHTALNIFRGSGADLLEVGLDDEGIDVAELAERLNERVRARRSMPKFVYVVPEFHNPTGVTMSRRRREDLVALAEMHGMMILEDDPYRRIRFDKEAIPPFQALASSNVISIGTFSKILAPGLRIAWISASPEVINNLLRAKVEGGSCPFTQRMIAEFCRSGRIEGHLALLRRTYARQRDAMTAALKREIPGMELAVPDGGYYLWVRLFDSIDTDQLFWTARRRGVEFVPGAQFYASSAPRNFLRLAYSYASPDRINEGVRRLGEALRESQR